MTSQAPKERLEVVGKRIICVLDKSRDKSPGGLFLARGRSTGSQKEEAHFGTVVIAYQGACVVAGDRVVLPGYGGQEVSWGEGEHRAYRDEDILAKIEPH